MTPPKTVDGIVIFGDLATLPDEQILAADVYRQARACTDAVPGAKFVLCADNHLGYRMSIGGVAAYPADGVEGEAVVSPTGVGYDIGCGNQAIRLGVLGFEVRSDLGEILDEIHRIIPFGVGQSKGDHRDDPFFDQGAWSNPLVAPFKDLARQQLGFVGGGNHFVDLLVGQLPPGEPGGLSLALHKENLRCASETIG